MRTRGFTFIEVLIVMVLIGIIAALGIPRIRDAIQKNNVRSARAAIGTLVAKARGAAVQRGCKSAIHFTAGEAGGDLGPGAQEHDTAPDPPAGGGDPTGAGYPAEGAWVGDAGRTWTQPPR